MKKLLLIISKKITSLLLTVAMLFTYALPITTVFADAPSTPQDYASIQINGVQTLENKNNTGSIIATFEHGTLTISGTGLYSNGTNMLYVPNGGNITLDANGNEGYSARIIVNGDNTNGSTKVLENLNYNNNVPNIVDVEFSNSNPEPPIPPANNTSSTISYNYNGVGAAEIKVNGSFFDLNGATPAQNNNGNSGSFNGSINYQYDDSGNVNIVLETLFIDRITSLSINGVDYTNNIPTTPSDILEAIGEQHIHYSVQVPYSSNYIIETTTAHNTGEYMTVGNFLWSYMDQDKDTDDYVGNGTFELVKVKYNGVEYTEEEIGNLNKGYLFWEQSPDEGAAMIPAGAEITVRLLPAAGYQLTSFTINGGEFEPGEEVGLYTFEVPRGNFHLGAHFTEVEDAVNSEDSKAVSSGTIVLGGTEASMEVGTARLDIKDIKLTSDQISNFKEAAGNYNISTYLDISLYNTVYKGSSEDTWDDKVTDLKNDATITLKLADDIDGSEVVIVHEKHDGTYEIIPTTYDKKTNTITFKTDSFSNYAIATNIISNPKTGDTIVRYIIVLAFSTFMLAYAGLKISKRKKKSINK